jgi:predicted amidohydrolase YtcJ
MTSGRTLGGLKYMADENILDRRKALELFTSGSASLIKLERKRGKLQKGFVADFAILSDDYFSVPEQKIPDLESQLTVVNGKIVYANADFKALSPEIPQAIPAWSPVNFYGGYQKN